MYLILGVLIVKFLFNLKFAEFIEATFWSFYSYKFNLKKLAAPVCLLLVFGSSAIAVKWRYLLDYHKTSGSFEQESGNCLKYNNLWKEH